MEIQQNFDLSTYNAFAVSCRARVFCEVRDQATLLRALEYSALQNLPVLVLGGGTNVLLTGDYNGLVLHIAIPGIRELVDADRATLQVGAGENWHQFVMYCLKKGFYGIENLSLIPGTVGAAPIQNIGAYGVELAEFFAELTALEIHSGEALRFGRDDCRFGYRDSVFKHGRPGELIVTSVSLALRREPAPNTGYAALQEELERRGQAADPSPLQIAEAVMAIRQRKLPDPARLPNCGSFFKNPIVTEAEYQALSARFEHVPRFAVENQPNQVKVPAAWLLEKAGWKGKRLGSVGVHKDQAVVLVNYGGASGMALLNLARDMQKSVLDSFGIGLEPEVRII